MHDPMKVVEYCLETKRKYNITIPLFAKISHTDSELK